MSTTDRTVRAARPSTPESSEGITVDEALNALPPDLQATLAELDDAPSRIAELVFAMVPDDIRDFLLEYGLVEEPAGRSSQDLALTAFGRRVIEACAADKEQARLELDPDDLQRRADDLRARVRESPLPMETRSTRA